LEPAAPGCELEGTDGAVEEDEGVDGLAEPQAAIASESAAKAVVWMMYLIEVLLDTNVFGAT
jgi:hypothetical protein